MFVCLFVCGQVCKKRDFQILPPVSIRGLCVWFVNITECHTSFIVFIPHQSVEDSIVSESVQSVPPYFLSHMDVGC